MISQYLTASIKIIQFSIPPPTLSIYVQNFSILLTLDVLFQMKPLSQNDTNQLKET